MAEVIQPYYQDESVTIYNADCRDVLPTLDKVQSVVTSPPYWAQRDYGSDSGLEPTPEKWIEFVCDVLNEVELKDTGVLWLNIGDKYARAGGWSDNSGLDGLKRGESGRPVSNISSTSRSEKRPDGYKDKDLMGLPWQVAIALRVAGWYLRRDIIWFKRNAKPESATDRPRTVHEYLFMLSKQQRYFYDDSRKQSSVWEINTYPSGVNHPATFPIELPKECILVSTKTGNTILDPFMGSGTTLRAAKDLGRKAIGIEIEERYCEIAATRMRQLVMEFK